MSQATMTTDHDEIRRWAEERGGRPSVVRTGRGRGGILRFDFGENDEKLEETSWEEFFRIFDDRELAFLHQDISEAGETSRFFKFVARDASSGSRGAKRAPAKEGASSRRAPAKAAKRSTSRGASKRASAAASREGARPKRASKAGRTARGGTKASTRSASKTGTKVTAKKSGPAAKKSGPAAKKGGTASRKRGSAASSAGLKGATKRTRSGGRASRKPSR